MPTRTETTAGGLATTVVEPDGPSNGRVLYCLPGGGLSRRYFDLEGTYSMAAHLANHGFVVVAIDHPGVGDSPPPDDAWRLTPAVVADADAGAVAELQRQLGGTAIGVGHSMGGMLTVAVQSRHRPYAALGLLGYAHSDHYERTALAAYLTDDERAVIGDPEAIAARLVDFAKARYKEPLPIGTTARSPFLLGDMAVPEEGLAAIDGSLSNMLTCCGLASMLKWTLPYDAELDVPVFIGFGEQDITGNARATANVLGRCRDITLFELPGSGHNHNVAPNRAALWDRLASWAVAAT